MSKHTWNGIAGASWQSLYSEGYTTWKSLYLLAVAVAFSMTSAVSALYRKNMFLTTAGSIGLALSSALLRLRPAVTTLSLEVDTSTSIRRMRYFVPIFTLEVGSYTIPFVKRLISALFSAVFTIYTRLTKLTWDESRKVTVTWAKITKTDGTWTEISKNEGTWTEIQNRGK